MHMWDFWLSVPFSTSATLNKMWQRLWMQSDKIIPLFYDNSGCVLHTDMKEDLTDNRIIMSWVSRDSRRCAISIVVVVVVVVAFVVIFVFVLAVVPVVVFVVVVFAFVVPAAPLLLLLLLSLSSSLQFNGNIYSSRRLKQSVLIFMILLILSKIRGTVSTVGVCYCTYL